MNSAQIISRFTSHLETNETLKKRIRDIVEDPRDQHNHVLLVDMMILASKQPELVVEILRNPLEVLPLLNKCAIDMQKQVQTSDNSVKPNVTIRFTHVPPIRSGNAVLLKNIPRSQCIGRLIAFDGTITRAGLMKMHEKYKCFECSKCKNIVWSAFDLSVNDFIKPTICNGLARDGSKCLSTQLQPIDKPSHGDGFNEQADYRDYQEIRIQESADKFGSIPRSISAILEDDLVDTCKPGDQVRIIGVVRRRWRYLSKNERCEVETFIHANNIIFRNSQNISSEISDKYISEFKEHWKSFQDNPLKGRNIITSQFAPKIFGLDTVKLAVFLLLIGGVQKNETGMNIRGESHLLLVGDPGTAKSQFLKFASRLVQRSVLTTGIGTTTAGLTCSAVKDGGDWHLEAGALVLADGGLCCIDEFGSIKSHEKTSIHEAMEQQTLSVAKAGLVCKLNTRCSILAATNPKGNFDYNQSLEVNLALGSPLLSRFDLIFVMLDKRNPTWDLSVSTHILMSELSDVRSAESFGQWASIEKLKSYVKYCKSFNPALTKQSEDILSKYYQHQRRCDQRSTMRTTIRLLESLIRIAQAHARLMCRLEVTKQDAAMAVYLMESSVFGTGLLGTMVSINDPFPDNPDSVFAEIGIVSEMIWRFLWLTSCLESIIMRKLGISD